ncbi:thiol-disulfide isomerase and thioredoxin [Oceanimonas sp. GK1]|uniref:glutaredoxin family protein n=1 Tax=Oceanimonas sp. (strain GK1 / IBRC-M 10197) TaxID=511062 RepID=UPI0002495191|nr:glutaredoxin family protein [Oceanimonas sp. GK1]AEY01829.1 thiol-disulfide isomerase and thioredoxin [Oceanimonas sp. GK1]
MKLTLFSTDGCHLCEQAWAMLEQTGLAAEAELKDIIDHEPWLAAYRLRIPVLRRADGAELDWPFTADQLIAFNQEPS